MHYLDQANFDNLANYAETSYPKDSLLAYRLEIARPAWFSTTIHSVPTFTGRCKEEVYVKMARWVYANLTWKDGEKVDLRLYCASPCSRSTALEEFEKQVKDAIGGTNGYFRGDLYQYILLEGLSFYGFDEDGCNDCCFYVEKVTIL
jgi:hypothetical protein